MGRWWEREREEGGRGREGGKREGAREKEKGEGGRIEEG